MRGDTAIAGFLMALGRCTVYDEEEAMELVQQGRVYMENPNVTRTYIDGSGWQGLLLWWAFR